MLATKDSKLGKLGKRYPCACAPRGNRFIPLKGPAFTNLLVCKQVEVAECFLQFNQHFLHRSNAHAELAAVLCNGLL